MDKKNKEKNSERRNLKKEYKKLYNDIAGLLFRHDPIHINFGGNTDEYEPEAGTILPQLKTCHSENDVLRVVHKEFVNWFGAEIAGSENIYTAIAAEIWDLWQKYR